MKRIIQNVLFCVLLLSVGGACEEDAALLNPDVSHGKSTVPDETIANLGSLKSSIVPNSEIVELRISNSELEGRDEDDLGIEDEVYVVLAQPAEKDITLRIAMDKQYAEPGPDGFLSSQYANDYLGKFAKAHNMSVVSSGLNNISLGNELLVANANEAIITIKAGEQQSEKIKLFFKRKNLKDNNTHLFPVCVTDVETGEVLYGKIDYLITIQEKVTRDGKNFTVVAYVDTEVMNPMIADQFIMEVQKIYNNPYRSETCLLCPAIDITNVRTAFVKNVNGRAILTYTKDMEYVLKNAARYLQPMQKNGMKVCLTIKGGGTGLGFANLSDEQIRDLTAQIQTAVSLYNLDGINLWDEGAGYGKEGMASLNNVSYARLIKALKTAMPDKLLTLVDTRETTEALCEEQDGIRVGDYLDYAWSSISDVLNPYAVDSNLQPLAGVPIEKYASYFVPEFEYLSDDEEMALSDKLMIFIDGMTTVGKNVFAVGDLMYMDYGKEGVWGNTLGFIQVFLFDMNPEIVGDGSYMWSSNLYTSNMVKGYYLYRKDW